MEVDESNTPRDGNSRASSRSSSRRSPMPMGPPSSSGIILNRPLGHSMNSQSNPFATLPRSGGSAYQRDYSCPPSATKGFPTRRSSSGIFITSMFGSRFRHLQKLHSDAFVMGLNAVCYPGLPVGTMFRSSLPATPVSTPIHREAFQQFTEQSLRERLCKTPSPRKHRGFSPLDLHHDVNISHSDSRSYSRGSDQPMDITCPSTPIEPLAEISSNEDSAGDSSGNDSQHLGRGVNRKIFGSNTGYRDFSDQT